MKLAFLGTGAAFSRERYNSGIVVDGRLLLDAGAPLLPHMARLGIDPGGIDTVFLTHFHGDHILGIPTFMLYRQFEAPRPLTVVGPPGVAGRFEALMALAYGGDWRGYGQTLPLAFHEAAGEGEVNRVRYSTVALRHGNQVCTGYRLEIDGRRLAYSGDCEPTPELDRLVEGMEVAVVEATAPGEVPAHTGWEQAQALATRHPDTRFIFVHIHRGSLPGAAEDLSVIDV